ncbi:MAG: MFS transporter [Atopobiaceae bacterium]|nr:MFS transporter [Atopobiaceae bacterium]MBQ3282575.1 MFS transporter [Atopobiaceae bacterium]MBQ6650380.1 MFS transporter [Atopobiaceae bacterium]
MKLNVRRTVLMGFAFFSICAFWQMYNNVIPLMLTNTFHMNETLSGVIMAADNVLALFLLPLFGGLSDKCNHPWGRRMPFVIFGTAAAVLLMLALPVIDNAYARAASATLLTAFVVVLMAVLVAMGTYRSPAVALMPDLTPKPLRSQGNAIINLMGAVGGILYLAIAAVLYSTSRTEGLDHVNYLPLFAIVAGIMVVSVAIVFLTIREPEVAAEVAAYEAEHPEENLVEDDGSGNEVLPAAVKKSLAFLLVSIALWFIGYNAMETWFTTYAAAEWGMSLGSASTCLIVANLGAIASYIPVGAVAARFGRKRTILAGVLMLGGGFAFFAIWTFMGGGFSPILYAVMVILGMGWACINVNSLPMVVEMCKGSDVGRFTGLYYTFSMAAQTITPIAAGWLMNNISYRSLFIYASLFVLAAFGTMQLVRHGDTTNITKRGLEALDVD